VAIYADLLRIMLKKSKPQGKGYAREKIIPENIGLI